MRISLLHRGCFLPIGSKCISAVYRKCLAGREEANRGICQWKLDTLKNNLDSNHRVNSVFGLLIQAATGALDGLGGISLNRSG